MITDNHHDGGCFQLKVDFCDEEMTFRTVTKWGDDFEECMDYGVMLMNNEVPEGLKENEYINSFLIRDDSK